MNLFQLSWQTVSSDGESTPPEMTPPIEGEVLTVLNDTRQGKEEELNKMSMDLEKQKPNLKPEVYAGRKTALQVKYTQ